MKTLFLAIGLILSLRANSHCEDLLTAREVIALGITQGVTEFLPVSSTAHMILVDKFLVNGEMKKLHRPIASDALNFDLETVVAAKKSDSEIADEAAKVQAKNSYFSLIQFGSIAAILCLYRKRFYSMALGILGKDCCGRKLVINLLISFLPAALIGFLIDGWLQKIAYSITVIASSLAIGALIIFFAERRYNGKLFTAETEKICGTIENLTSGQSFAIGLWQCLAFIPGMSRSMATIVGGYGCGLRRTAAAEYSFLLGVLTLAAAAGYKFIKDFDAIFTCFGINLFCLGILVAFLTSLIAIKIFITFIGRHGILLFAFYRIILAIIIFCQILS
ncbi:MAG: undecaprenyl-diphosphate phosphatase [Puniceicoccales bacterium]|nr:undecaprenyl-diphosphate phosphatase [Puniceicoccales bacterium]